MKRITKGAREHLLKITGRPRRRSKWDVFQYMAEKTRLFEALKRIVISDWKYLGDTASQVSNVQALGRTLRK